MTYFVLTNGENGTRIESQDKGSWSDYNSDKQTPIMIIKGEIIVPKPVEVVKTYTL